MKIYNFYLRCILFILITLAGFPGMSFARPIIDIQIGDLSDFGRIIQTVSVSGVFQPSLDFQFIITEDNKSPFEPFDVYFGGITPSQSLFTWVPDSSLQNLENRGKISIGLSPISKALVIDKFTTAGLLLQGKPPAYRFNQQNETGLYVIFCILVVSGKSPYDPQNWLSTEARLFVVTP